MNSGCAFTGTFWRTLLLTVLAVFLFAPAGATLQNLQPGMKAPPFNLSAISGETKTLAALAGKKVTVVVFWSTWTRKSEAALTRMDQLFRQYRDRGLAIVAINADGLRSPEVAASELSAILKRTAVSFPVLIDPELIAFHDYGIIALPSTIVIDSDGIITYELSGYPLIGAEELTDFVVAAMDGKQPSATLAGRKKTNQPNPQAVLLFNMGTKTLRSKRMADTAEEWFTKAVVADPSFALPWLSLGRLHLRKGESARAREDFAQALSREPDNVIALCETALLMAGEGKIEEGKALLAKARSIDDAYPPAHYYAGYLLGKTGQLAEGLKMFEDAAGTDPHNADLYLLKARLFEETGALPEAAEAYRQALEFLLPP